MSEPFFHTLHGDPVDVGLEPVKEGDFWIADEQPYVRSNNKWEKTNNHVAWMLWANVKEKEI